jgi:hypothetical protein
VRVEVAVGIDPDDARWPVMRDAAHRADGDRVIAADENRDALVLAGLFPPTIDVLADSPHRRQEPDVLLI